MDVSGPGTAGATLTELLECAASGTGVARFLGLPGGPSVQQVPFAQLWRRSEAAAAYFRESAGSPGEPVGLLMTAAPDCLAALLGAWRAGLTAVSLPQPGRGVTAVEHRAALVEICRRMEIALVAVPGSALGLAEGVARHVVDVAACAGFGRRWEAAGAGDLVQFSSGSTGTVKGVHLTSRALAANVLALLDRLGSAAEGLVCCSWCPLSHDMGLVAATLAPLVGMGRPCGAREVTLMPPHWFLRSWLPVCSARSATVTYTPNFALDLAARQLRAGGSPGCDLSTLRAVVVGAEPVRGESLRRFAAATAPYGFDETALCPGYGMAEVSVAVSLVAPARHWTSVQVDTSALGELRWEPAPTGLELVSCGPPVAGVQVRVPGRVGRIEVSGDCLMTGYTGDTVPHWSDGWLVTDDLATIQDGELYIVGRADDVILTAGRTLYPADLEATASGILAIGTDHCAVVADGEGGYVVVAERRRNDSQSLRSWQEACRRARRKLVERHGIGPSAGIVIPPGTMPRTSSGKLQRTRLRSLYRHDQLSEETAVRFGVPHRGG
ncbi:AMP-binding protein [Streptomyces noursei]|uniref:AMP-binding protein n=1 Tax=Streptomyces noursei TaxID=1971 RepID=UPI0033D3FB81